ncbi:MAG: LuxR C-terminal-related transcriptional regulator [Chloroflexota bacterium]
MTQPNAIAPERGPEARALIEAKLRPPRPSGRLVARPALARRLDAFADRVLTLVAAPTGYGKTTALAAWAAARPRTAWVTLDATDDEPIRFARSLVAAVARVAPGFGAATNELLDSPVADILGAARTSLVNELEALEPPVTLVLDDLHAIRSATCQALLAALVGDAPHGLRLVVATRSDPGLPLGRLRAAGRLGEIRAADLRFDPSEADALLGTTLGLHVPPDAVERLTARTEGWAAGLVLAGMSAEAAPDPAGFVEGFSGSDRTVVDYLGEEVLAGMPAGMRRFLTHTAVVEELSGELGDTLTGGTDGAARLDALARANAFVVRLDAEGRWYRYHRLFREVLLTELAAADPGASARLLGAAAGWYEAHGMAEQAARAALAAGDHERAGAIIATAAREVMRQGDLAVLRVLMARLDRSALGPMWSAVEVTQALAAGLAGEPAAVIEGHLAAAEAAGPLVAKPFALPDVVAARAFTEAAYLQDDVGRQARAAALLRERYPEHPLLPWLGRAGEISAAYFSGEAERVRAAAAAFGLDVAPRILLVSIAVISFASLVATDAGDLATGELLGRRAHDAAVAGRLADAHAAGLAYAALGAALAARGEPAAALPFLERSLELRGRNPGVHRAHALLALAPVRAALGDSAAAHAAVREAAAIVDACPDAAILPALLARTRAALPPEPASASAPAPARSEPAASPSGAQLRVLRLLPGDLSSREIAAALYLSHDTVKSHTRALYRILGVDNRADAVARARALGLLPPP